MASKQDAIATAWSAIVGVEISLQEVETMLEISEAIFAISEPDEAKEPRIYDLDKVAQIYKREIIEADEENRQPKPARLIAETFGIKVNEAYNLIWGARQEDLIPPTQRGRVGQVQDYYKEATK